MENNCVRGKTELRNGLLLAVNLFLFLSTMVILVIGLTSGADDAQLGNQLKGVGYLKAFTVQSNLLCGITGLIMAVFALTNLLEGTEFLPRWAVTAQFIASCAVGLTFVVVVVFLAPLGVMKGKSYFSAFHGQLFFFHFLNPLLSCFSVSLLASRSVLTRRDQLLGEIPTLLYSLLYLVQVVILKNWTDFYNFTLGGKSFMVPVALAAMYGLTWLIGGLLKKAHNRNLVKRLGGERKDAPESAGS